MKNSKRIWVVVLGLFFSCDNKESQIVKTQLVNLKHSIFLEAQLAGMGLVDRTKLSETLKKEIEELEIIRYANISDSSVHRQIVIIDFNRNGKFEYDSVDLVGLTGFKEALRFETINFAKSKKPVIVHIDGEQFEVHLQEDGGRIELIKKEEGSNNYELTYPYQLPNSKYKPLTNNATLNKDNGKFTYVEFWGTWCKPCIQIVPEIKQLKEDFDDQLNVVGVNYRDSDMNKVKQFILKKSMNWDHIVADAGLLADFGNPSFVPCGMLFDPRGRLVQYGIKPNEVRVLLLSGK